MHHRVVLAYLMAAVVVLLPIIAHQKKGLSLARPGLMEDLNLAAVLFVGTGLLSLSDRFLTNPEFAMLILLILAATAWCLRRCVLSRRNASK